MMRRYLKIILLTALLISGFTFGQPPRDVTNNLHRLKTLLDRTTTLVELLPASSDRQVINAIRLKLKQARQKFERAVTLAQSGQGNTHEFKVLVRQVLGLLRQIETIFKSHPLFKIKFQESLDRQIQEAENALRGSENREALYMLNRAKFFRRKAYLLFKEGRTYAALEYFRLSKHFAEQVMRVLGHVDSRDDENRLRNYYLDTQLLLQRARDLVNNSETKDRFADMLSRAERELKEAEKLYERKNYHLAKQRITTINRALYRIIDVLEKVPENASERLRLEVESIQVALQSLHQKINNGNLPAANRLHQRTEKLVQEIYTHIDRNQLRLAQRKTFFANQLMLKLYQMVDVKTTDNPQLIENQINTARQNLEELKAQKMSWKAAEHFVDLIEDNLRFAERAYQAEQYLKATFYLKLTNRLILKYNRMQLRQGEKNLQKENIRSELEELSALLARIKTNQSQDTELSIRYENALKIYRLAEQAFAENELWLCAELTQMAFGLLSKGVR